VHHEVVDCFYKEAKKLGLEYTIRKEIDLRHQDLGECDLVISIGGDSTYLQSAGVIDSSKVPLLGVNSDPLRRKGFLTSVGIEHKFMHKQISLLLRSLMDGINFEYFYRTRALFRLEKVQTEEVETRLCLNEVFAAEKDVSTTSVYALNVDDKDMGRFKSSGIIISTGTGSSGWLYSAR
jgi:NAD+ kinase